MLWFPTKRCLPLPSDLKICEIVRFPPGNMNELEHTRQEPLMSVTLIPVGAYMAIVGAVVVVKDKARVR